MQVQSINIGNIHEIVTEKEDFKIKTQLEIFCVFCYRVGSTMS